MTRHFIGHEFDALKLRYEDQVELFRYLMQFDFRIFTAFFAVQLALGGWLAAHSTSTHAVQCGLATIWYALGVVVATIGLLIILFQP